MVYELLTSPQETAPFITILAYMKLTLEGYNSRSVPTKVKASISIPTGEKAE